MRHTQRHASRRGRGNNGTIVRIDHGPSNGDARRIVLSSRQRGGGELVNPTELADQRTKRHGHHETINGLYEKVIGRRKTFQEVDAFGGALPNASIRFDLEPEGGRDAMGHSSKNATS